MKTIALAAFVAATCVQAQPQTAAPPSNPPQSSAAGETWETYKAKARKELDAIGDKINALDADAHAKGAEAGADAAKTIAALRAKKNEAEVLLTKLETTAEADRKELKAKLERAIRQLKREYRKAVAGKPAAAR